RWRQNIQMSPTICAHFSEDSGDWFRDERQRRIFIVSLGQRPRTHVTREIASAERNFLGRCPRLGMSRHLWRQTDAIDRNPPRANFHVAVAKTKRAGQLTLLGHSDAKLPASPAEARLETFPNPAPQRNYRIHFETDDFTSVCPVTGQPDFA